MKPRDGNNLLIKTGLSTTPHSHKFNLITFLIPATTEILQTCIRINPLVAPDWIYTAMKSSCSSCFQLSLLCFTFLQLLWLPTHGLYIDLVICFRYKQSPHTAECQSKISNEVLWKEGVVWQEGHQTWPKKALVQVLTLIFTSYVSISKATSSLWTWVPVSIKWAVSDSALMFYISKWRKSDKC